MCVAVCWPPFMLLQGVCWGLVHYCVAPLVEGARFEVLPVFRGGVVAWAVGVFLRDVDVFAGEPPGDSGEEWQLFPKELNASLLQVSWDACRAER